MSLENRVEALESRLAALEEKRQTTPAAGDFWALDTLRKQANPKEGAVLWTGTVPTSDGPVEWQMQRSAGSLIDIEDTTPFADRLSALGNPVRVSLLLSVLRGTTRLTDLADELDLASTGQLYHHVKTLSSAGWLRGHGRGQVQVPAERTVPLLVILGATQ
ncbi:ArsR/SmtB family transcription factor [Nesterenkonia haasae]|uniref:ArsR/SmtB family transcription factor n=1 Tax=Nesterenkonia haasae TaxID=2587813 RepID=UPI0013908C91|nr:helix-turn-helix domain-containing protein [Nesterenkonia haasae]NDK31586.1 helix-turn-helix transcriptional regulator [Nesterenkonia haasae]